MKHRFYSKSQKEQNRIQFKIAIAAVVFNLLILLVKTYWRITCVGSLDELTDAQPGDFADFPLRLTRLCRL